MFIFTTKFFNKNLSNSQKHKGFSLSEVLITLGIIGIVASLTIPAIIEKSQNMEYKIAWKKIYSDFEQATKLIMLDNGGSLSGIFTTNGFKDAYAPYLKYSKECTFAETNGVCFHGENQWYNYDGTPKSAEWGSSAILNNGALLFITSGSVPKTNGGTCDDNTTCGWAYIDVNGFKAPNKVGIDIFGFEAFNNRLLSFGRKGGMKSGAASACVTGTGWGCSTLILINQDY